MQFTYAVITIVTIFHRTTSVLLHCKLSVCCLGPQHRLLLSTYWDQNVYGSYYSLKSLFDNKKDDLGLPFPSNYYGKRITK